MADIFVSYARKYRDTAQRLASALEAVGHSVWWDREIRGGENFDEAIERELDLASVVIVLWSKQSASSNWVRSEAAAAAERGVLVPVFIEQVKLPLEFRRKQTIDLTSWRGDPGAYEFGLIRQAMATHLPPVAHLPSSSSLAGRTLAAPADQEKPTVSGTSISILRAGMRAVPAVKYALGIASIGAAIAMSAAFFASTSTTVMGIAIMLAFMILLLVLAAITGVIRKELRNPALVITWCILLTFLGSVGIFVSSVFHRNLLANGSFEQIGADGMPYKWELEKWRSIGEGGVDKAVVYSGLRSARVSSVSPGHVRWMQAVKVAKDTSYILTAMMKTAQVTHAESGDHVLGANIGVLGLTDHGVEIIKYSDPVLDNNDWRKERVRFETGANERILIVLELGGYSAVARGTVWFDDVHLEIETTSAQK
jgi:hypothetical protein